MIISQRLEIAINEYINSRIKNKEAEKSLPPNAIVMSDSALNEADVAGFVGEYPVLQKIVKTHPDLVRPKLEYGLSAWETRYLSSQTGISQETLHKLDDLLSPLQLHELKDLFLYEDDFYIFLKELAKQHT